ncbi:hypothetical protein EH32_11085 [Erythrobacter litoralis]|uniref:Uncharacterized protein n=1 Tax=Erythrobacter litoralis TaxID=39960 RepID=A0A074MEH4_9SPHN|nr:hypothetical protein EH32_11085 [Erythrobacter litoralis]
MCIFSVFEQEIKLTFEFRFTEVFCLDQDGLCARIIRPYYFYDFLFVEFHYFSPPRGPGP